MSAMEPGIVEMDADQYHADPCPTPSLSAGMIGDLLSAPAKCRENSRRLNPSWEAPEKQEKFSIGTVSHVMFLEPHLFDEKVVVVQAVTAKGEPSDTWATKDAKDQRDAALAAGKTPILAKHMAKVLAAREAFYANGFTASAFAGGRFEQAMFWRHPRYGFWCRARPDFLSDAGSHLNDYKATANADPAQFGKHAYSMGYHRRAAWYLEGAEILLGKRPDHYWYVNQETKAPYLTSVIELDMQSIEAGQAENDKAARIFQRCLDTGDWYGYRHASDPTRDLAFQTGLPSWAYIQIDQAGVY
jgi:PDDEXK-like uncharacterized protein DUF3799